MAAPFSIVGQMLGHYRILEQIGAGGMGEVYRAQDTRLERQVAIKILPAEFSKDEDRLRRFEREARAAAALNHPNILAIYDVQIHDGSPFIISELLQGTTLRGRLITGALPLRVVIDYAAQILHGLTAAHQKHIVHRDLKPENLFITRDNRVKILDFGLAKLAEPNQTLGGSDVATMNTTPGMVMGTLAYMSPEQLRGRKVDERSDIFSFGAILYEMVSANRAFQAETNVDIITAILTQDPLERSEARSALPPALERVVRHCLEKSPEDRFQSARDLLFNLEAITGASPTVAMPAEMAPARSKPYLKLFLAALMLITAVSLGLVWGKQMFSKYLPSYHQL